MTLSGGLAQHGGDKGSQSKATKKREAENRERKAGPAPLAPADMSSGLGSDRGFPAHPKVRVIRRRGR